MPQKLIQPSIPLRQYIHYYYVVETDHPDDFFPTQRVYPHGNIILVFHYRNPSLIRKPGEESYTEPKTVICGQQTCYYDLGLAGNTGMIFVVFAPFASGMFFNIPMHEIIDKNIRFEDVIGKEADILEDKIQNAVNISERIKIIDDFLMKSLSKNYTYPGQIQAAFGLIKKSDGLTTVESLGEVACLGKKQFERKFASFVGMYPKSYLRIVRFQNLLTRKYQNDKLISVALENGFYDQSHFIREFKAFTGVTPGKFFNNKKGIE